jgi:hypothetical protein
MSTAVMASMSTTSSTTTTDMITVSKEHRLI